MSVVRRVTGILVVWSMCAVALGAESTTGSVAGVAASVMSTAPGVVLCQPLPTGHLSDEELQKLVPEGGVGKVRIRWRVETQEDNYGYNIQRSDTADGTYKKINTSIIPGQGSTNIPMDYCYEDRSVARGQTYYYYIESISTSGVREIVEGTKGTRVKVKSVDEERAWLKAKAAGEDTTTTGPAVDNTGTTATAAR
ncbi:MAG: hypothetical protein ACR2IE_10950 [Candidatus Sumerlaeaceae bacterium]